MKLDEAGLMEFLAIGSAIRSNEHTGPFFSTACSGQDLFCQLDAGYQPRANTGRLSDTGVGPAAISLRKQATRVTG